MKKYLLKRIVTFLLVLLSVSLLCFALINLFGNDPAQIIARRGNINATQETIEAIRVELGLDKPLMVRYLLWIRGLFTGDVGVSIYSFKPIMEDIGLYFPVSLILTGLSLLWALVISVPVGILCARFSGRIVDHFFRVLSVIGICFPPFWLGFLLLLAFAVKLPLFSVAPAPGLKGYILPSVALAVPIAGAFIRVFRSGLLKEMSSDHALYAKARGLSQGRILVTHALRNAAPPVVTMLCQYLGYLIAGAVVIESIFSLKGVGTYLVDCVKASDSTAAATCIVIISAIFITANFAGDLLNRFLCPWMVKEYNA